jgi:hypothetical protein
MPSPAAHPLAPPPANKAIVKSTAKVLVMKLLLFPTARRLKDLMRKSSFGYIRFIDRPQTAF